MGKSLSAMDDKALSYYRECHKAELRPDKGEVKDLNLYYRGAGILQQIERELAEIDDFRRLKKKHTIYFPLQREGYRSPVANLEELCELIELGVKGSGAVSGRVVCIKGASNGDFIRHYDFLGRSFREICSDIADETEAFNIGLGNLRYLLSEHYNIKATSSRVVITSKKQARG